jgi:predicted AlkP superfamily pyrophosphatase or phosphodiesterase
MTGLYPEHHGIIFNHFKDNVTGLTYKVSDSIVKDNGYWYRGETFWETAHRHGIKTGSVCWPGGTDIPQDYRKPDYCLNYLSKTPYNNNMGYYSPTTYKDRIDCIIKWLNLPYNERPRFISTWFEETDDKGHEFGPNSPEINEGIGVLDDQIVYLFDQLKKINLTDSVNIIIVADHGMSDLDQNKTIDIKSLLGSFYDRTVNNGSLALIKSDGAERENLYNKLKSEENHYKIYKKEDFPKCFHYNQNDFIDNLIILPENGWYMTDGKPLPSDYKATHGWDNNWVNMQGIFIAYGPLFKKGYRTGTLNNIDIYPLLCKIFNFTQRSNIDGALDRIEFILKD